MPAVNTVEILKLAKKEKRGIGAFNIVNLTQIIAVSDVAQELKYPLLMQTSPATASFYTPELVVNCFRKIAERIDVPIALHLDHCRDIDFAKRCALAGYNSVMVDFSKSSYEENINKTSSMVKFCRKLGNVSVEGEIGIIPGVEEETVSSKREELLCTPDMALDFVKNTEIDFLAPAIGTAHGIYKTDNPIIDFERLKQIDQFLKENGFFVPLVVHGCSGLPEDTVKRLIVNGATKFNVSTNLKQKVLKGFVQYFKKHPDSNNTLELEKITKNETYVEVKRWMNIFIQHFLNQAVR